MLEIKISVTKMKNAFDEGISKLDMAEGLSHAENISLEFLKNRKAQRIKT